MPIYEFICRDCQSGFEKLTSAAQRDKAACPRCDSERTVRKISLAAPAQVKSGGGPSEGCGLPQCCGGSCGFPNN